MWNKIGWNLFSERRSVELRFVFAEGFCVVVWSMVVAGSSETRNHGGCV